MAKRINIREKIINKLKEFDEGFNNFELTDFESLNGKFTWDNTKIKRVCNKLKHLKEPIHERLKSDLDLKSNICGGYPFNLNHKIDHIFLSFTKKNERAHVPYPQLNVEINENEIAIFFYIVSKAKAKAINGQRIRDKYYFNLINALKMEKNRNYLESICRQNQIEPVLGTI